MQKVKMVFWLIIIVLIGIFIYQNHDFLFKSEEIKFNIVYGSQCSLKLPIAIYLLTFFLVGFLIAYFFNLAQRFHSRKVIKQLNDTIEVQKKKILELESKPTAAPGSESADA